MGNQQSKNIQSQKFISQHPHFIDARVVTEKNRKYIEAKSKTQSAEYQDWNKNFELEAKNKPKQTYLLFPEHSSYKSDTGLCGNSGTLTAEYPYYPHILSELIRQRQPQQKMFKQSQLWYLLYTLAAAKQDIKVLNKKVGDIKPENIFVNQGGHLKVANVYSWPHQLPSYQKAIDQSRSNFNGLLSPQDLTLLQSNQLYNDSNDQSQMFAIGATVLSAGILQDVSTTFYNYKERSFNVIAFRDKRRKWAECGRYSEIFRSIIWNLIELNPVDRLNIDELWSFIVPYQNSILQKKQFVIQSAPPKIERSFAALKSKAY